MKLSDAIERMEKVAQGKRVLHPPEARVAFEGIEPLRLAPPQPERPPLPTEAERKAKIKRELARSREDYTFAKMKGKKGEADPERLRYIDGPERLAFIPTKWMHGHGDAIDDVDGFIAYYMEDEPVFDSVEWHNPCVFPIEDSIVWTGEVVMGYSVTQPPPVAMEVALSYPDMTVKEAEAFLAALTARADVELALAEERKPLTISELAQATGHPEKSVSAALFELRREGRVKKQERAGPGGIPLQALWVRPHYLDVPLTPRPGPKKKPRVPPTPKTDPDSANLSWLPEGFLGEHDQVALRALLAACRDLRGWATAAEVMTYLRGKTWSDGKPIIWDARFLSTSIFRSLPLSTLLERGPRRDGLTTYRVRADWRPSRAA